MLSLLPFVVLVFVILLTSALFRFLHSQRDALDGRVGWVFVGWLGLWSLLLTSKSMFVTTYYDYFALEIVLTSFVFIWSMSVLTVITISSVMPHDESEAAEESSLSNLRGFGPVAGILLLGLVLFWVSYSPSITDSVHALIQGPVVREGHLEAVSEEAFRRTGSVVIDGEHYTLAESAWVTQTISSTLVFVTDPARSAAFSPMMIAHTWFGWVCIGLSLAAWLATVRFIFRVLEQPQRKELSH